MHGNVLVAADPAHAINPILVHFSPIISETTICIGPTATMVDWQ